MSYLARSELTLTTKPGYALVGDGRSVHYSKQSGEGSWEWGGVEGRGGGVVAKAGDCLLNCCLVSSTLLLNARGYCVCHCLR